MSLFELARCGCEDATMSGLAARRSPAMQQSRRQDTSFNYPAGMQTSHITAAQRQANRTAATAQRQANRLATEQAHAAAAAQRKADRASAAAQRQANRMNPKRGRQVKVPVSSPAHPDNPKVKALVAFRDKLAKNIAIAKSKLKPRGLRGLLSGLAYPPVICPDGSVALRQEDCPSVTDNSDWLSSIFSSISSSLSGLGDESTAQAACTGQFTTDGTNFYCDGILWDESSQTFHGSAAATAAAAGIDLSLLSPTLSPIPAAPGATSAALPDFCAKARGQMKQMMCMMLQSQQDSRDQVNALINEIVSMQAQLMDLVNQLMQQVQTGTATNQNALPLSPYPAYDPYGNMIAPAGGPPDGFYAGGSPTDFAAQDIGGGADLAPGVVSGDIGGGEMVGYGGYGGMESGYGTLESGSGYAPVTYSAPIQSVPVVSAPVASNFDSGGADLFSNEDAGVDTFADAGSFDDGSSDGFSGMGHRHRMNPEHRHRHMGRMNPRRLTTVTAPGEPATVLPPVPTGNVDSNPTTPLPAIMTTGHARADEVATDGFPTVVSSLDDDDENLFAQSGLPTGDTRDGGDELMSWDE